MNEAERIRIGERVVIYPRGKRRTWTADFWDAGGHQRQSLKTTNKKIATSRALAIEHKLANGTYQPPAPATTIIAAKEQYFAFLETERRAAKTIVRYTGELNVLEKFASKRAIHRIVQITPTVIDAYRNERLKTHHEKTVHHETMVIKGWLKWCESRRLITENPLKAYRVSKPQRQPKPAPTLEEVQTILAAASQSQQVMFAVLAFTGVRVGELRNLRATDVDLPEGWLNVVSRPGAETKTRRSRKIPIHGVLRPLLEFGRRRNHPFFFTAEPSLKYPEGDHQIDAADLNEDFQRIAMKLGMQVGRASGYTLHSLRHFFETHCVNSGVPQRAVDTWMGHVGDKSMGAVYYWLSEPESQAMMARVPFSQEPSPVDGGTHC